MAGYLSFLNVVQVVGIKNLIKPSHGNFLCGAHVHQGQVSEPKPLYGLAESACRAGGHPRSNFRDIAQFLRPNFRGGTAGQVEGQL